MRFHLIFSGFLPSSGNKPKPKDAQRIRDELHPQLEQLWRVHRALQRLKRTAIVDNGDSGLISVDETPFDAERDVEKYPADENEIDLTAPIEISGKLYKPLVRNSLNLNCSLSINFLRNEDPGAIILQGGDIDGRLKTLLDALTMPKPEIAMRHPSAQDITYCLMESDSLVSKINIDTDRLLVPSRSHHHDVHLLITIEISVLRVARWNMPLLGN